MAHWIDSQRFQPHPMVLMGQRIIANLEEKLGFSRQQWRTWLKEKGLEERTAMDAYLKQTLKLGSVQRRIFFNAAFDENIDTFDDAAYLRQGEVYLERQYAGKKEHLRPLYAHCVAILQNLGEDVRFCPCKTYLPAYRNHVFAHIIPATQKRIDLGLALGDLATTERLKSTGGLAKGDRITHKVAITSAQDFDEPCLAWIQLAYAADRP